MEREGSLPKTTEGIKQELDPSFSFLGFGQTAKKEKKKDRGTHQSKEEGNAKRGNGK